MSAHRNWLRFDLLRRRYALPAEGVAAVERERPLLPVPGAPGGVLGVTERRGRVLTVLDCATLLDDAPTERRRVLVILRSPLAHVALSIAGELQLDELSEAEQIEGAVQRVDPLDLLARAARNEPS